MLDWVGVRSDCCTVGLFWGQIWTQSPAQEAIASSKQSHCAIRHSINPIITNLTNGEEHLQDRVHRLLVEDVIDA